MGLRLRMRLRMRDVRRKVRAYDDRVRHTTVASSCVRRHTGDGSEEAPRPSTAKATEGSVRKDARVHMRGTYITFTEYWHGEGAVGVMSITDNRRAPGLTLIDGFDCERAAHDVVVDRHGIPMMLCDVSAIYADPHSLRRADVVCAGAPCVHSSFAPHYGCDTEPDADDPMNAHYPRQVQPIVRGCDVAVLEYLSDVRKVRSLRHDSPNAHRPPGWRHDDMIAGFSQHGWSVFEYDLNAWYHGSAGARRRLYSIACSDRAMEAAKRAGVMRPAEITPIPYRERLVMRDILEDDHTIEMYHAYLFTGHRLTVPKLYGDARDQRQVTRLNMGGWETEPVGDVRLPAMPMKCFGQTPLIMLEDGRVRRMLLCEFARVGAVPWSVGHGISVERTDEELRAAKVMMGNTWDANFTKKVMEVAADFVKHLVHERAHEPAPMERVAARFATIVARTRLPARRALRRWREVVKRWHSAGTHWWRPMAERLCVLQMRRIGWMGLEPTACAAFKFLAQGPYGQDLPWKGQGEAAGMSKSGSVFLSEELDRSMVGGHLRFTECMEITRDWMPAIRNTATQKRWGARLALPAEVSCKELYERPLPVLRIPPATTCPPPPTGPTPEQQEAFRARFPDERSVWTADGWRQLSKWEADMQRDAEGCAKHGTEGPDGYRVRMKGGTASGELRLGQKHLQVEARGVAIEFDDDTGAPSIASPKPMSERDDCVIKLSDIKEWIIANGWRDRFMIWVCDWGWADLTSRRPLYMSFSPNMKAAYERYHKVCAAHTLEITRKWSRRMKRLPFAGEIHIVQTNAVDKSDGTARLLGNATHPEPDTYLCEYEGIPLAPNMHTDWSFLPRFEWASIDRFGEVVAILCSIVVRVTNMAGVSADVIAMMVVVGSRDDLEKWFRQVPQFSGDHCKQVYHWAGEYIVDWHVQMGRGSSADGAQRLSMIGGQIVFDAVEEKLEEQLTLHSAGGVEPWHTLSVIVAWRRQCTGCKETGLWALDLMQDDLGYVAVTREVGQIVRDTIPLILEKYGISVSMAKRAEDEAIVGEQQPNERMLYIGADYRMEQPDAPGVRGQDKSLARFEEIMTEWDKYPAGKLVPVLILQRTIGMSLFHGKFQLRARRYLNSMIRCLRGRNGDFRVVSKAPLRDLSVIWQRASARVPAPMVQPAVWFHPGLYGCNSDASRPQGSDDISRGFGGNVLHHYFFGEWTREETERLDISTLELLAVAFLVVVAHLAGVAKPRMVIRCDNEAACRVINDHSAGSVAMGEALMHLEAVQCEFGVELLAHHIAGEDNAIADELSRDKVEMALVRLRELTGMEPVKWNIPAKWRSTANVLNAVRGR